MKTRVIPAQITTVEDKIIGNLNLIQIVILLASVFGATIVFAFLPPAMTVVVYKIILMIVVLGICGILAIRIKEKLVIEWIGVLARFNIRPKYYVFDKNDVAGRRIEVEEKIKAVEVAVKTKEKKADVKTPEMIRLNDLIENNGLDIRFRTNGKGGLNVAFEKVGK